MSPQVGLAQPGAQAQFSADTLWLPGQDRSASSAPPWPQHLSSSPNNFLDHFDSSVLDATKWATVVSGTGTATITDSYLDLTAPANSTAFLYYTTQIDKTKSQMWFASVSFPTPGVAGFSPMGMWLANGASAPAADTHTNQVNKTLIRRDYANQSSNAILDQYWSSAGTQTFWDGTNNAWTTTYTTSLKSMMPVRANDYYTFGLEIDGVNQRWRLLGYGMGYVTANTYTFNQGLRLFALTGWITWANTRSNANVWLAFGMPYNNDGTAHEARIEWVRYIEALAGNQYLDAWCNVQGPADIPGDLKHYYSLDGFTFVPQDSTTLAITHGAAYDNTQVGEASGATDNIGVTDYLAYDGNNAGVCISTAPHVAAPQNGPWTKYASNPIIPLPSGWQQGGFPWLWMDTTDPDPNKRWKCLWSLKKTSDSQWRQWLYYSPDPPTNTANWRGQQILDLGAAGTFDATACRDGVPVYYNGQWELWYEGWDANGYVGIGRATGPSLLQLTKDGQGARIVYQTTADTTITAFAGVTATVGSSAGFTKDAYVWISAGVSQDTYITNRIRKIVNSTTIEFYHNVTTDSGWLNTLRLTQIDASRHFTCMYIVFSGSTWRFHINQWYPWLVYGGSSPTYTIREQEGGPFEHQGTNGPASATPAINHLSWPGVPRGFTTSGYDDTETSENISFMIGPYTGA